ncbi:hypothetical protein LCGC14_1960360, partial [marine sediment metagenome]
MPIVEDKLLQAPAISGQPEVEEFPITDTETDITKTPAVFSSQQGADIVDRAKITEDRIAPPPVEKTPEEIRLEAEALREEEKREVIPLTLINPETGQESTFGDPEINIRNIQRFIDRGFEVVEGALPARVTLKDEAPEVIKANQELEDAKNEVATLTEKLTNFDVSQDPALKQQIANITSLYDTRITQMERVNESRAASLAQTGIRLGGRFTENIFGGIITEEERQGITRVGELETLKQNAIINARTAFRTQKWNEYVDLINVAERALERQQDELTKLNDIAIEQNKEIEKRQRLIGADRIVSEALTAGFDDISEIFRIVDAAGLDITSEELVDSFSNLTEQLDKEFGTGGVGQFRQAKAEGLISEDMGYFEFLASEAAAKKLVSGTGPRSVNDLTGFERLAAANLSVEIF